MNPLREIWEFPAHYVALAWWITVVLTVWNVRSLIRSIAGRLALFGRRFQKDQLSKRLRNLEYLHENTNGLIRYMAEDAFDFAVEMSFIVFGASVVSGYAFITIHESPGTMLAIVGVNLSTSIFGPAWRIRALLRDLKNYPESAERLREKLSKF